MKKEKTKPLHDKATRRSREENPDREKGAPHRLHVATLIDHHLSASHFQQVALTVGTVGQCLRKTLGHDSALAREVQSTLCELTRLGTNLARAMYQALFLFISAVFVAFPTMSDADCASRKTTFKPIAYADSSRSFTWLLSKLVRGDAKTDHDVAGAAMYRLLDETIGAGSNGTLCKVLGIDSYIRTCLSHFINAIALHVQDVFQRHMCSNVSELKKRVRENVLNMILRCSKHQANATVYLCLSLADHHQQQQLQHRRNRKIIPGQHKGGWKIIVARPHLSFLDFEYQSSTRPTNGVLSNGGFRRPAFPLYGKDVVRCAFEDQRDKCPRHRRRGS